MAERTWRLPLALALVLLAAPAAAHRLLVFASAEGATILGSAYFSGGRTARGVTIEVRDAAGTLLASLTSDASGEFSYRAQAPVDHLIIADGADGWASRRMAGGGDRVGDQFRRGAGYWRGGFSGAWQGAGNTCCPGLGCGPRANHDRGSGGLGCQQRRASHVDRTCGGTSGASAARGTGAGAGRAAGCARRTGLYRRPRRARSMVAAAAPGARRFAPSAVAAGI